MHTTTFTRGGILRILIGFFARYFALAPGPPASTGYMQPEFILRLFLSVGCGDVQLIFFLAKWVLATLPHFWRSSDGAALWRGVIKAVQTTVFPVQRDIKGDFSDVAKYLTFPREPSNSHYFLMCAAHNVLSLWESSVARWLGIGRRRRSSPMWAI